MAAQPAATPVTGALVIDADAVGAVAGLRALAAAGMRTAVLGAHRSSPALLSRHAGVRAVGPDPLVDPDGFRDALAALARAHGPHVVYPARDDTLGVLMATALPDGIVLPFSGAGPVRDVSDKRRLAELAPPGGLRVPATLAEGPAGRLAGVELPLPVVVKPTRRAPGIPEVEVALTRVQLDERLGAFPPDEPVLIQEAISGDLECIAVVVGRDGRLVERFHQRVLRVWPSGAGAAATAVSVEPDEALCAGSARMLAAAGFWGLAQLDFMVGAGGHHLIDVNPRFYISLSLAGRCGVNLPAAWHRVVTGEAAGPPSAYRTGVGYRRLESDITAAVHGEPRLLFDRPRRPVTGSVWSASDPLPAAAMVARRIGLSVTKRLRPPSASGEATALTATIAPPDDVLAAEWRALERGVDVGPYRCWDWLAAWRDVYSPKELLAIRVAPVGGGPPVALGLLERRSLGRWRFAGAPVSTIRGLLVADADAPAAWAAVGEALRRSRAWSSIDFAGMDDGVSVLPGVRLESASAWAVRLPPTFDEYLAQRSSNQRSSHRRKLRKVEAEGAELVHVDPRDRPAALEDFIRLHLLRAEAKGEHHPQMDARLVELLRRLERSETIDLRLFALRVEGRTVGISVRVDRPEIGGAWFYNGGFDPEYERLSPGIALELRSIRDAIEQGLGLFDLGIGHWRYKEDLGGIEVPLVSGTAYARGPRGWTVRSARACVAAARAHAPTGARQAYRRARRRLAAGRSVPHQE